MQAVTAVDDTRAGAGRPASSGAYGTWIAMLALLSLVCVIGIFWGELTGRRLLTGVLVGIVLLAYSFILLFLRRGGFTGV